MKAMVFAAGLGTRLKPITDSLPKALVPVCGQPLLYHVIGKLRDAGYTQIVVNVHHFPDLIREWLSTHDLGVDVSISDESACLLETGGGILHAQDLILPCQEPFLVHNVDIVSNLDLGWVQRGTRPDALATLVVSQRETRRQLLFNDQMRLVGWLDRATGEVRSPYPGLDPSACRQYAFAGVHNLHPRIFPHFGEWGFSGRFPIMDFYLKTCAAEPIFGLAAPDLQLVDVGKFESLPQAEQICETLLKP
ncbi:MAG: NTP transferase domain-containing protein [Bacteroidales bacterium]|nr:NTP transferase domain-containing protein [Bacteroidales bacterium]